MASLLSEIHASEMVNLIEQLGAHGVTDEGLRNFRRLPKEDQEHIASLIQGCAPGLTLYLRRTPGYSYMQSARAPSRIADATDVFSCIHHGFGVRDPEMPTEMCDEMDLSTHALTRAGQLSQILGRLEDQFDRLAVSESQVVAYVNRNTDWLSQQWDRNSLFLLRQDSEYFVARVYFRSEAEARGRRPTITKHSLNDPKLFKTEDNYIFVFPVDVQPEKR